MTTGFDRLPRPLPETRVDIPAPDQGWYWTPQWQEGERAADADIAAGRLSTNLNPGRYVGRHRAPRRVLRRPEIKS